MRARAAAERALALDPDLAEAHSAQGLILAFAWKWDESERAFQRALELNPGSVWALRAYAVTLAYRSRIDEALELMERVRELDPLAAYPWQPDPGTLYVAAGQPDRALDYWKTTLAVDPSALTPLRAYGTYLCGRGETAAALELLERAHELAPDEPFSTADLGYCYAISGRSEAARSLLRSIEEKARSEYVDPSADALVRLGLGDREGCLAALERALEVQAQSLPEIAVDGRYDPLRQEPRFQRVMREIGLGAG